MAHAGQFDRRSTASFRSCAERIGLRSSIVWRSRHSQVMLTLLSTAAEAPLRGSPASLDSVQLEWLNEVQHLVADSSRSSRTPTFGVYGVGSSPRRQRRHLNPGLAPWSPDALTWHVASPANPARAARATSGANPAHDTRFRRDPSTFPASRESRRYFSEIIE
jgi:hypothetical protein